MTLATEHTAAGKTKVERARRVEVGRQRIPVSDVKERSWMAAFDERV